MKMREFGLLVLAALVAATLLNGAETGLAKEYPATWEERERTRPCLKIRLKPEAARGLSRNARFHATQEAIESCIERNRARRLAREAA